MAANHPSRPREGPHPDYTTLSNEALLHTLDEMRRDFLDADHPWLD